MDRKYLLLLALAVVTAAAHTFNTSEEVVEASFESTEISLKLEIADTPEERRKGLMYRRNLESRTGMIFIYDTEEYRSFWMKNTYIPLDVIFLDSNMTVINIEQAEPQPDVTDEDDLKRYRSEEPAQYVVELNQGFADNYSLGPGDRLVLERKLVE